MPTLPFEFAGVADGYGVIHIQKRIPVGPVRITITQFSLRTANGCEDRKHYLQVSVNHYTVFAGQLDDCIDLHIGTDRSWRGILDLSFKADGFGPGEEIRGDGEVRFRPSLF